MRTLLVIALLFVSAPLHAQPAAFDPTRPDIDGTAPPPDRASGVEHEEAVPASNTIRWIPRVALLVPRWTLWTVAQPVRLGAWAYEQYSLKDRIKGVLFNVDGTYGAYPVASFTTDFGFDVGARFVHKDLLGDGERLKLRANFGGRFQQAYGFEITSGKRLGEHVSAKLEMLYERRPNERFFGIGNTSELVEAPEVPLDPTDPMSATSSRFRENWFRTVAHVQARVVGPLALRVSGALAVRELANYGIEERFDTAKLVGYENGVENIYVESELVYDSRRPSGRYQPRVVDSTGWYASAHLGRATGISGDPTRFWRYGGEVQRFIDLYGGTRVLTLRAMVDATSRGTDPTDPRISFIDLPRLGGNDLLRGYPDGRFRDRTVALASAEYTWDLGNFLAGYLFVDAGRTAPALEELALEDIHVGFGGGVQVHTNNSFLLRAQLAISRDGDAFLDLVFSPAFGRRERAGRY